MEYHRRAEEIRERAATENRDMTAEEEREVRALERAAFNCMLDSAIGKNLKQIEQDAKAGRLKRVQLQLLRMAAQHGYVKAQEILRSAAGAQK